MPKSTKPGFGGFVTMPLGIFRDLFGTRVGLFQTHLHKLPRQRPGGTAMTRYLLCFILLSATIATAQTPIPRVDDKCPIGTYRSSDYCKPFASAADKGATFIQKVGDDCPTGFYTSGGSYCKRIASSDREAIPREHGSKCPSGWYKSGDYCRFSWSTLHSILD
jgi:hypothetical protein